jgi:chemotaxis signal transduction protein
MTPGRPESSAAASRFAFDRSFAETRGTQAEVMEDLLAIRVGGDPYAVRALEIASLHVDRRVIALPSRAPTLLGLVGLRGAMAPVYDLRAVLGYPGGAAPRWLVLVRTPDLVGLAFDLFESHVRATAASIARADDGGARSPFASSVVCTAEGVRPLLHTPSLIEAITKQPVLDNPAKEY